MSKNPLKAENSILSRFARSERANVGIIFGIVLVPLMIAMGSGVDYSRAYMKQKSLATAVDTAVLAGGVYSEATEEVFQDKVTKTLYANFPEAEVASLDFNRDPATKAITVTATSNVNTLLAGIWNVYNIPIAATAEAAPSRSYAEIVMVLDNSSSMASGGKIEALRDAANELVEILYDSSPNTDKLFISLVPFSGTVRLNSEMLSWSGIDFAGVSSISGEDFAGKKNPFDVFDDMPNNSWGGCIRARPDGNDLLDTPANPADPETLFPIYLMPDEPNGKFYNDGQKHDHKDRYRSYIDDEGLGLGDWGPDIQRDTTKYSNPTTSSYYGPEYRCPTQPILPLTTNESALNTAIDGMAAERGTNIATGLAWGWRMLTPGEPYVARNFDLETKKFIILLTDGANSTGYGNSKVNHNNSYYGAYGYAAKGHLGDTDGSESVAMLNQKTAALCEAAKGYDPVSGTYDDTKEIKIFTIMFDVNSSTVENLFRNCATTPDMYYNSPDNETLQTTFQEIANELLKLQLTK